MKRTKLGQELITGLTEAVAHEKGRKRLRSRKRELPAPAKNWRRKEIVRLRKARFEMSQAVFAHFLNVAPATIRAWEQGLKKPSAAANRLLDLAESAPEAFDQLPRPR